MVNELYQNIINEVGGWMIIVGDIDRTFTFLCIELLCWWLCINFPSFDVIFLKEDKHCFILIFENSHLISSFLTTYVMNPMYYNASRAGQRALVLLFTIVSTVVFFFFSSKSIKEMTQITSMVKRFNPSDYLTFKIISFQV